MLLGHQHCFSFVESAAGSGTTLLLPNEIAGSRLLGVKERLRRAYLTSLFLDGLCTIKSLYKALHSFSITPEECCTYSSIYL